jgi:hypothetical protein
MKEGCAHNGSPPIATAARLLVGPEALRWRTRSRPDPQHRHLPAAISLGDAWLY